MAVVSKKTVLILLVAFILLSIALRYPLVEHERFQTDSFTIHYFSKAIRDDGYAVWIFHPLSFFGYYPLSYPSGVPFLVAELSSMTGMSIELSILVANWGFAAMFCLGVFVLARQFINRPEFALIATLFSILGARFVDTSYWDGSARGPLVVLITLAVFTMFRAASNRQNKLLIAAAVLSLGCFVMHHMAVLLVLFGLGYLIAAFQPIFVHRWVGTPKGRIDLVARVSFATLFAIIVFECFVLSGGLELTNPHRRLVQDFLPAYLIFLSNVAVLLTVFAWGYFITGFRVFSFLRKAGTQKGIISMMNSASFAVLIAIIAFQFFDYFRDLALRNLQSTSLFDVEPIFLSVFLNMAVSYTNQIGFILLLAVAAIPGIFRHSVLSIKSLFPITLVIAFIPLYGNSLYVSMIISPFVAVLGTIWLSKRYGRARKKTKVIVVISLLLVISVFIPVWSSSRWNQKEYLSGDTVDVDNKIFSDAAYLRVYYPDEYAIYNSNTMWIQLAATSRTRFLASGIPSTINGDITNEDITANVTWSSDPFPTNLIEWFEYEDEPDVDLYVRRLMTVGIDALTEGDRTTDYFSSHSRLLVAVDNNRPLEFSWVYGIQRSLLTSQLKGALWAEGNLQSYVVYESGRITLYAVQLPV